MLSDNPNPRVSKIQI